MIRRVSTPTRLGSTARAGAQAPTRLRTLIAALTAVWLLGWGHIPDAQARPPQIGDPAPEFRTVDLSGREVSLADFRGQPVLLTFWATWCDPCTTEMPEIEAAFRQHQDEGFVVLAVNFGERLDRVREFAASHGLTFPVLIDRRANIAAKYGVISLPVSVFLDQDGVVRERVFGGTLTADGIERALARIRHGAE
jgi:peroxiredoxin